MRKRHGWTSKSPMPSRYVHLVNADVEKAVLEHHGLQQEREKPEIQKCSMCGNINTGDVTRCETCDKPLDLQTAIEIEERENAKQEEMKQTIDKMKENEEINQEATSQIIEEIQIEVGQQREELDYFREKYVIFEGIDEIGIDKLNKIIEKKAPDAFAKLQKAYKLARDAQKEMKDEIQVKRSPKEKAEFETETKGLFKE